MVASTVPSERIIDVRQRALQRTEWLLTGDWVMAEDPVQATLGRHAAESAAPAKGGNITRSGRAIPEGERVGASALGAG
jgi:hypothetical protein